MYKDLKQSQQSCRAGKQLNFNIGGNYITPSLAHHHLYVIVTKCDFRNNVRKFTVCIYYSSNNGNITTQKKKKKKIKSVCSCM